jgi:hypothetical protein
MGRRTRSNDITAFGIHGEDLAGLRGGIYPDDNAH